MTRSVFLVFCLLTFNGFDVCSSQSTEIFISFKNDSISVEEGVGTVQVRLIAYGKYETPFTVGVTCFEKLPVEAKVGTVINSTIDVYPESYTVEFNDVGKKSSMSTPLTINIVDDPLVETRESFVCIVFQPLNVPGVQLGNPRSLEITIVDNNMEIEFTAPTVTVVEREGPAEFCVERRGDIRSQVDITVSTGNITGGRPRAEAYLDYTPLEDTVVTFPAGVARVCFIVNITDDDVLERLTSACNDTDLFEYASVSITRASTSQATGWMSSTAELVIEDDDVVFEPPSELEFEEGVPTEVCLTVCGYRDETLAFVVMPAITDVIPSGSGSGSGSGFMHDSEAAEEDLILNSSILTFPPGAAEGCINVTFARDDTIVEPDQMFEVIFEPYTMDRRSRQQTGAGTTIMIPSVIKDNDPLNFTLTVNFERRKEGRNIIVRVKPAVEIEVAINIKLNITDGTAIRQTAVNSGDYNYKDSDLTGVIDPTDTRYAMTVMLLEDDLLEGPETFTISLESATIRGGLSNPVVLPPPVTVTIQDEDRLCVTFGSPTYSVDEGGRSDILLLLDKVIATPVDVVIEFGDNSATSPDDYDSRRQRVRLPTGATMGKATVTTLQDKVIEDTESFTASYRDVSIGAKGCSSQTTVNIVDRTLTDVDFNPVDYTTMEGDTVTLSVELSAVVAPGVRRRVDIRTENGTAHSPGDFNGGTFTVEFFGSNRTSLDITTTDDNTVEGTETFTAILENPSSPLIRLGHDITRTISITETESITVYFSESTYFVNETSSTAVITVEASGPYNVDFNVTVSVMQGTAQYGLDYNSLSVDLAFKNGIMSTSFEIEILDDKILERDEDLDLRLFVPKSTIQGANVLPGVPNVSRVVIIDDEGDGVHISFHTPSLTVREDVGSVRLQLQSSGLYGRRFSVSFTCIPVFPVEAKDGKDFKGGVHTVQFGENQTVSTTAEIAIVNDSLPECTKSFICVIFRPRGEIGIATSCPNTITVVIEDDDAPFIQFVDTSVVGVEGDVVSLVVNRSRTITRRLKCTVRTESTTAIAGVDYRLLTNSIEFKRRNTAFEEKTIHILLLKDKLSEEEECLRVVLECRPKDLTGCYPPTATVCIQGN